MKKLSYFLGSIGLMLILTACPYSSDVYLDTPNVKVDQWLLGDWKLVANYEVTEKFSIQKKTETTYAVTKKQDDGTVVDYTGWTTIIGGKEYFTISENTTDMDPIYYFYLKEKVSETELKLTPVSEYIDEKFTDSGALREFFEKHQHFSFFYSNAEEVYAKL